MVQAWYSHKKVENLQRKDKSFPNHFLLSSSCWSIPPFFHYNSLPTQSRPVDGSLLKQRADERQANVLHGGIEQKIRRLKQLFKQTECELRKPSMGHAHTDENIPLNFSLTHTNTYAGVTRVFGPVRFWDTVGGAGEGGEVSLAGLQDLGDQSPDVGFMQQQVNYSPTHTHDRWKHAFSLNQNCVKCYADCLYSDYKHLQYSTILCEWPYCLPVFNIACVCVYNDSKWVISLTFAQSAVYYITSPQPLCSGSQALIFNSY